MRFSTTLCAVILGLAVLALSANDTSSASSSVLASSARRTNTQRIDPYKNFKFRVMLDGRTVAAVNKVGGLVEHTAGGARHRAGGDPSSSRKSPGRTEYEAITLERGITQDAGFQQWASKISLGNHTRRDLVIEAYDESGKVAASYKVFRCWVSEYQVAPDLDANANAVAIEHIKLENEG